MRNIDNLVTELKANVVRLNEIYDKIASLGVLVEKRTCGTHGWLYGFLVGLLILVVIGLTVTVYNFGVYSEKIGWTESQILDLRKDLYGPIKNLTD